MNNIEVCWVPQHQIGAVIKVFGYYLLRGLKAADYSLDELVEDLVNNRAYLGVAFEIDPFRPLGCWVSDIRYGDQYQFATVYALAGERLPAWVKDVDALVESWARATECYSFRFFGRAAYKSLLPHIEVISTSSDGRALLFERKLLAA
jgi:hypothetical protein